MMCCSEGIRISSRKKLSGPLHTCILRLLIPYVLATLCCISTSKFGIGSTILFELGIHGMIDSGMDVLPLNFHGVSSSISRLVEHHMDNVEVLFLKCELSSWHRSGYFVSKFKSFHTCILAKFHMLFIAIVWFTYVQLPKFHTHTNHAYAKFATIDD